jgi:hypothetical protein
MIYKISDENQKEDNNITVDFYFDDNVTSKEAQNQIAMLVRLADNDERIQFTSYRAKFWSFNPYNTEEE